MAGVQEAFDVPASIMTKILIGEYRRIGGVGSRQWKIEVEARIVQAMSSTVHIPQC